MRAFQSTRAKHFETHLGVGTRMADASFQNVSLCWGMAWNKCMENCEMDLEDGSSAAKGFKMRLKV